MHSFRVYRREEDDVGWATRLRGYIELMTTHYGVKNKTCCGIDVRLSGPFVRRDVGLATAAIECVIDENICGFALLKTHMPSDCVYIVLVCSFQPGVGRNLMSHLVSTPSWSQRYLVARSTDQALGFYLHLGFRLFNFQGTHGYITIGDEDITNWLRKTVEAKTPRNNVRDELRRRRWIEEEDLEWPVILVRRVDVPTSARRSSRIQAKVEACTLRG